MKQNNLLPSTAMDLPPELLNKIKADCIAFWSKPENRQGVDRLSDRVRKDIKSRIAHARWALRVRALPVTSVARVPRAVRALGQPLPYDSPRRSKAARAGWHQNNDRRQKVALATSNRRAKQNPRINECPFPLGDKRRNGWLQKQWENRNKDKLKEQGRVRAAQRRKTDPIYKLHQKLCSGIKGSLSSGTKNKHVSEYVGMSIAQIKEHLEKQFKPGYSWDNYSHCGWHVDHIVPISLCVKLGISPESIWHYSNLQPLWWSENFDKKNNIIKEHLFKILAHPEAPDELVDVALVHLTQ